MGHPLLRLLRENVGEGEFICAFIFTLALLLKIVLLACSRGLVSSWTMEGVLRQTVLFLAVCGGATPHCTTLAYVSPINAVLFAQTGGSHGAEEIRTMAARWIMADRLWFVVGIVAFLAILWAFKEPIPRRSSGNHRRRSQTPDHSQ